MRLLFSHTARPERSPTQRDWYGSSVWIVGTPESLPDNADANIRSRDSAPAYNSAMTLYEALQLLAMFAVPIVAGGLALIVYRIRSIAIAIDRSDSRIDAHGERLATMEAQFGQVAELRHDVKDVHRRVDEVLGQIGEVANKVSVLEGQLTELTRTNKLIQEHLMRSS